MNREERQLYLIIAATIMSFVLIVALCLYANWYAAGQQAQVWNDAGAEITQWQVFIGVKPITREVIVK